MAAAPHTSQSPLLQQLRTRHPLWLLPVICCAVIVALNLFRINTFTQTYIQLTKPPAVSSSKEDHHGFLVKTSGCRIPDMLPMDPSIRKYIFTENPILCNNGLPPLVDSNLTAIFLIESSLVEYNVSKQEQLDCCYKKFQRVSPKVNEYDKLVSYDECVKFKSAVMVMEEFISVSCKYNKKEIYQDYFSFAVAPKTRVDPVLASDDSKLNVLIIGLDAISRLNFLRQMPKTVKFLDQYHAAGMLGYNKVADNTFPNLIPVLTGRHVAELSAICWPDSDAHFDACEFVWDRFRASGYVTAFGEDSAWMGIFNYQKRGFSKQPTDYFWNNFDREAENKIGDMHRLNVYQCIGSRLVHRVLLDYIERFCAAQAAAQRRYFALFWQSSLSHDVLNKPRLGDDDYYWLLKNLEDAGQLNRTVLIVMSDHGIRWGGIRSTFQGRMEERLPFLYIGLPEWVRERLPHLQDNLMTNARRLTTPFDLHETLVDLLLPLDNLTSSYVTQRNAAATQRGYSLFGPIRESRGCDEAGIPAHFCTCQSSEAVSTNDSTVLEAGNYTVTHINKLLDGYADCALLDIEEIVNARVRSQHGDVQKEHNIRDYILTVKTRPGGGLFEATVRRRSDTGALTIAGTISRINLYGSQSLCITDYHLKLYCYCKQFITEEFT